MILKISISPLNPWLLQFYPIIHTACVTCHSDSDAQGTSRASCINSRKPFCVCAFFCFLIACHLCPRPHFVVRLKIWDLCQIYHCALHMRLTPCDISLNSTSGGKTSTNESENSLGPSPKRKPSYCVTLQAVEYLLIENRGHGCEDQSRTLWSSKLHGNWGCYEFLMSSLSITISNLEWHGFVISFFFILCCPSQSLLYKKEAMKRHQ